MIEERLRFVVAAARKAGPFGELCSEFGISRQTGYTWLKRYREGGVAQVEDRSRRPLHSPARTPSAVEERVIALRTQRPDWGAPKLHAMLTASDPQHAGITVRTVHRILARHHLIRARRTAQAATKRFERNLPNELWQMDFKGPGGGKGAPVGPLSILDDHSRFVLALEQLGSTQLAGVQRTVRQTFEQCGLPDAMLMDHGTPWWNGNSPWGMTELSVWIMRQGVRVLFSGIGHPQTQGKVERMHGALERASSARRQDLFAQDWLDAFRHEYNHVRPHEALAMQTPSSCWQRSPRFYKPQPPEWEYSAAMQVVALAGEGQLRFNGQRWDISHALRRERVGLCRTGERVLVYFCATPIRELDLRTGKALPIFTDPFRVSSD